MRHALPFALPALPRSHTRNARGAAASDVHPDAVEAMLASVPDLSDALADYAPPELAQLLEDFDVEITYDKHRRTLQLAATLALDTPPETARPPRGRSHKCDIAGAGFEPATSGL
jgi:hypothetical protein